MSSDRRPLASRQTGWARTLQGWLLRTPLTANQISVAGILFAALGAVAFAEAWRFPPAYLAAAACIQLRLLCNLMDGLVAVEGGRGSPTGALFNEVPDRLEDSLLLAAFGYAAGLPALGFVAAILAVFTAYLRMLGVSHGLPPDFRGPMAKPHRMAALTVGSLAGFVEALLTGTLYSLQVVLAAVAAGTALTAALRLGRIAAALTARSR